jgi:hypothetical protein
MRRVIIDFIVLIAIAIVLAGLFLLFGPQRVQAACHPEPVTDNTPSGIAGCYHWGRGDASQYTESGWGAAMNFCTWTFRAKHGCGSVRIVSLATGNVAVVPVVDFCDCYQRPGPNGERLRIVDLQGDVVRALGMRWWSINPVTVHPATGERDGRESPAMTLSSELPDTAVQP